MEDDEFIGLLHDVKRTSGVRKATAYATEGLSRLSAILICLVVNLLDATSYGYIIFPISHPFFAKFGLDGISMFLWGAAISQLLFSMFSSFKRGVTASMMVELIPYMNAICLIVYSTAPEASVMPTVFFIFIAGTFLIGLAFYLMAALNFDRFVYQVPKFVLLGSIGGIGGFLLSTAFGLALTTQQLSFNFIFQLGTLAHWLPIFLLGAMLFAASKRTSWTFLIPLYCIIIIAAFYLIFTVFLHFSLEEMRKENWLFSAPQSSFTSSIQFFRFYDFRQIHLPSLLATLPQLIGMVFFGLLHVPINVPSFACITKQEGNLGRELKVHGISNMLNSVICANPNYFVYSTSVLFFRAGGRSWIDGIFVGFGTFGILFAGLGLINFLPKVLIGSLIVYLGFDLLYVATVESFESCRKSEFFGVLIVIIAMMSIGFTEGLMIGAVWALLILLYDLQAKKSDHLVSKAQKIIRSSHLNSLLDSNRYLIKTLTMTETIFFSNAYKLSEEVKEMLSNALSQEIFILDYSRVKSLDSNAIQHLQSLHQKISMDPHITVISSSYCKKLLEFTNSRLHIAIQDFDQPDDAMAWAETLLIERLSANLVQEEHFIQIFMLKLLIQPFIGAFGDILWKNDSPSDCVLLLLSGSLKEESDDWIIFYQEHTLVGVESFFQETIRNSTLSVVEPCTFVILPKPTISLLLEDKVTQFDFTKLLLHFQKECAQIMKR